VSDVWITIAVLTVTTAMIRASGPVLLGGRDLPPLAFRVIALLAPALLAALVMVETFTDPEGDLELGPQAAGLAAAGGVLAWNKAAVLPAITLAAVATAVVRAVS
jgi:branched-subunit amino acid transport protein